DVQAGPCDFLLEGDDLGPPARVPRHPEVVGLVRRVGAVPRAHQLGGRGRVAFAPVQRGAAVAVARGGGAAGAVGKHGTGTREAGPAGGAGAGARRIVGEADGGPGGVGAHGRDSFPAQTISSRLRAMTPMPAMRPQMAAW